MGRVEFGAHESKDGEFTPFIAIQFIGEGPGQDIVLEFNCNMHTSDKDSAKEIIQTVQKILAGANGMRNFTIHEGGKASELIK